MTASGRIASEVVAPRAIVAGAARGIGAAIAERLVGDGFDVVLLDLDSSVAEIADDLGAAWVAVDLATESAGDVLHALADERPPWQHGRPGARSGDSPRLAMSPAWSPTWRHPTLRTGPSRR